MTDQPPQTQPALTKETKTFDILSIGGVYLDINAPNFPFQKSLNAETQTVGGSYILTSGGSALIFSKVSAFLGLKPVLIGKVGSDTMGEILLDLIKKTGINPVITKSPAAQTNISVNFMSSTGETIMTTVGTANQFLTPDEGIKDIEAHLSQVKYLYISSYFKLKDFIPFYPDIFKKAKALGTKIIIDHGAATPETTTQERNILMNLMRDVDLYLPRDDEFLEVWQAQDIEYALNKAKSATNATIVVKQAQHGSTGSTSQETVHVPAFPVVPLSTIGAGDSFNAGFLKATLSGKNLKESLAFANATAALAISQKTLPTVEQIQQFVATKTPTSMTTSAQS